MQPRRTTHDIAFSTFDLRWGILSTRPADVRTDATLLHRWLLCPSGELREEPTADVRHLLAAAVAAADRRMFVGFRDDVPSFLFEVFEADRPPHSLTGADVAMRLLAPPVGGGRDLVAASLRMMVEMLFQRPEVECIALEAEHGESTSAIARGTGFRTERHITVDGSPLRLTTCTREDYEQAPDHARAPALAS